MSISTPERPPSLTTDPADRTSHASVQTPVLFALGWSVASVTGIGVDDRFTVFGAGGALLFTLLSGVLLARFAPLRARVA